jgi:hypothetical protein
VDCRWQDRCDNRRASKVPVLLKRPRTWAGLMSPWTLRWNSCTIKRASPSESKQISLFPCAHTATPRRGSGPQIAVAGLMLLMHGGGQGPADSKVVHSAACGRLRAARCERARRVGGGQAVVATSLGTTGGPRGGSDKRCVNARIHARLRQDHTRQAGPRRLAAGPVEGRERRACMRGHWLSLSGDEMPPPERAHMVLERVTCDSAWKVCTDQNWRLRRSTYLGVGAPFRGVHEGVQVALRLVHPGVHEDLLGSLHLPAVGAPAAAAVVEGPACTRGQQGVRLTAVTAQHARGPAMVTAGTVGMDCRDEGQPIRQREPPAVLHAAALRCSAGPALQRTARCNVSGACSP